MIKFIIKRAIYGLFVLMGVVSIVFLLFNVLPGDPARMLMGQRADKESLDIIKKDLGLDKPIGTQYLMYINDLSPLSYHSNNSESAFYLSEDKYKGYTKLVNVGDRVWVFKSPYLRKSYQTKRPVTTIIGDYIFATFVLAVAAIVIATFLGIFFGILSALNKGSFWDQSMLFTSVLGMSVPSFYAAIILSWLFGYVLSEYTGLNMTGSLFEYDDLGNAKHLRLDNLILPALTLGIRPISAIMQLTRSSMLDVLSQDYIRTARSKGLKFKSVILKHALKNAMNPVLTTVSGMFASLLAGALFVENVFAWKGIGWILYDALVKFDLPIVMGGVLVTATIFVVINIIVDVLYGFLDPRVSIK